MRQALNPIGESRPDWEIICDLAGRMGYPMNYGSPKEIMDELADRTSSYGGFRYDQLEGEGLQWPCPTRDHPGIQFLHEGRFAGGRGKCHAVEFLEPDERPDDEYPLLLTTGRVL